MTALHDLPPGQVWTEGRIRSACKEIASYGMHWAVAESLPVSEEIKYGGPRRDALLSAYCTSLANLGRCGVKTVCYNFMPVIDWVRTDLDHRLPNGCSALYFNYLKYAYFDIKILGREGAQKDYAQDTLEAVERMQIGQDQRQGLIDTIIVKTQGFVNGPLGGGPDSPVLRFKKLLAPYAGMGKADLLENLRYFLQAVMPVCRQYGINMCIHPDDPPMQVFGLPRIAGSAEDIQKILDSVDDPHNGLTFCAGSLSAGAHNRVEAMARDFAPRTHFVHLRSCRLLGGGDFIEAPHTGGGVNLVEIIRTFVRTGRNLPMRVDHGMNMLGDEEKGYNPGYGFHGRMLALGQVQGMICAVRDALLHK